MGDPKYLPRVPRADDSTEELSRAVTSVKLPISLHERVHALPNRTAWLRRVISEAAQRELMRELPGQNLLSPESRKDGEA
jgi:hypothetical protein